LLLLASALVLLLTLARSLIRLLLALIRLLLLAAFVLLAGTPLNIRIVDIDFFVFQMRAFFSGVLTFKAITHVFKRRVAVVVQRLVAHSVCQDFVFGFTDHVLRDLVIMTIVKQAGIKLESSLPGGFRRRVGLCHLHVFLGFSGSPESIDDKASSAPVYSAATTDAPVTAGDAVVESGANTEAAIGSATAACWLHLESNQR
jgi:hypothetical protein